MKFYLNTNFLDFNMNNQFTCTIECLFKSRYEFMPFNLYFGVIKSCDGYRLYRKLRISVPFVVSCRNVIYFIIPYHNASGVRCGVSRKSLWERKSAKTCARQKRARDHKVYFNIFSIRICINSTSKQNFRTKNLHIRTKICN